MSGRGNRHPARCNSKVELQRDVASLLLDHNVQSQPTSPPPTPLEALVMALEELAANISDDKRQEILSFSDDVRERGEMDLQAVLADIAAITGVSLEVVAAVFHQAGVLAHNEVGLTFGVSRGGGSVRLEIDIGRRQRDGAPMPRKTMFRGFISFRDLMLLLAGLLGTGTGWALTAAQIIVCIMLGILFLPVALVIGYGVRKSAVWAMQVTRLSRPALAAQPVAVHAR